MSWHELTKAMLYSSTSAMSYCTVCWVLCGVFILRWWSTMMKFDMI